MSEGRRHSLPGALVLSLALALVAFFGFAPTTASATKTHLLIGKFGSAAEQTFKSPDGLAVDQSTGALLVIDARAKTISRWHFDGTPSNFSALSTNVIDAKAGPDQTPQNGFIFGNTGGGEQQIAVDNSGTLTDGNIYVTQGGSDSPHVVSVFASSGEFLGQLTGAAGTPFASAGSFPLSPCGVAVDGSGNLFVGAGYENKVYKFDPSANPPLSTDLTATFTHDEPICNLAAGAGSSNGSVFANTFIRFDPDDDGVLKLSSASLGLQGSVGPPQARFLAIDPVNGHLYIYGGIITSGNNNTQVEVGEYAGASLVSSFLKSSVVGFSGIAVDGVRERVYTDNQESSSYVSVYGPMVTVPDVTTSAAELIGDTSFRLNGSVDPDGVELEECFFEYGLTASYGQTIPCVEAPAEIGTGPRNVHAEVSGLSAETLYHFRLVAKNSNDTVKGFDKTFRTPGKPAIKGLWSQDVGLAEATIKGQLNPENSPTTYRFEWGPDSSYGNSTAEISIGSGEVDKLVSRFLVGLTPGATYHYRVVASNGIGTTEGDDHTFITYPPAAAPRTDCSNQQFRTGSSATLPNCRAYEMVSPVDKNGNDIRVLIGGTNALTRLDQSSDDGNRFAYSSSTAFGDAKGAPWSSAYLASRTGSGWSTHSLNPPRESVSLTDQFLIKLNPQYWFFDSELNSGWFVHITEPTLDECAPPGFINLYRRDNTTGEYETMIPVEPKNVSSAESGYRLEVQGTSTDGTRTVFMANSKLTKDAANSIAYQIYEHVADDGCGELRLVSYLPNGKAASQPASAGTGGQPGEHREKTMLRAVSADASRIFFAVNSVGPLSDGPLYLRVNSDQEQSPVSGGKCTDLSMGCTLSVTTETARFWTATTDASRAVYSVGEKLYEFDTEKALAGESASTLIAVGLNGSQGVAAANEDLSRLYFVSTAVLDGEGEAGKPNLYLREEGATRLVATLGKDGGHDHLGLYTGYLKPIASGARWTADGRYLAFVTTASPTGYDNRDAADGMPNAEVHLYDAVADKLICISCNPSGARPRGRQLKESENHVGARVSGMMAAGETQTFFPRALSADGNHLFFESFEALLPRDTNGKADVYEWQRGSGEQACQEVGAELYVPSAEGCLSLISTGQSPVDSEFADATPDGHDVFIRTQSSLLPQDVGLIDIYDARVNGGFPQPPLPPAACEGEACQGPLDQPDDPTPASAAFEGSGNVKEEPVASCRKGKVRRKGRCVAKKTRKGSKAQKSQERAKAHGKQKRSGG